MKAPNGKSMAVMVKPEHQCDLKVGAKGYVDGYVQAADKRPYAIFVSETGCVDMVSLHCIRVIIEH